MISIRKKLLAGSIGAMVVLLFGAGVLLFFMVRATLLRHVDDALLDKAKVLMSAVEVKSGRVIFDDEDLETDEFDSMEGPAYLQIHTDEDKLVFSSASLTDTSLQYVPDENEEPVINWIDLPAGRRGRAVFAHFVPHIDDEDAAEVGPNGPAFDGSGVELIFARDTSELLATLGQLEVILLVFGTGTIALAGATLHSVVHRALAPLESLASQIHKIKSDELSTTITLGPCPRELEPVIERLNELLARLQQAFNRERAFSADVAHELRTPLAGIRSTIEVALSREREAPEYAAALQECIAVANAMQTMVENLLTLARLESGEFEIVAEDVALSSLVESVLAPMQPQFAARNISLYVELEKSLSLHTDSALLQIVARNLLDNALAHTDIGGHAEIRARRDGTCAMLRVANSGSRVSSSQIANVFDRFWRADAARSDTGAHVGLGLALVKKIVNALEGTVEVASRDGGEFSVSVTLPNRRNQ